MMAYIELGNWQLIQPVT